jgi:hypothetical protein
MEIKFATLLKISRKNDKRYITSLVFLNVKKDIKEI